MGPNQQPSKPGPTELFDSTIVKFINKISDPGIKFNVALLQLRWGKTTTTNKRSHWQCKKPKYNIFYIKILTLALYLF